MSYQRHKLTGCTFIPFQNGVYKKIHYTYAAYSILPNLCYRPCLTLTQNCPLFLLQFFLFLLLIVIVHPTIPVVPGPCLFDVIQGISHLSGQPSASTPAKFVRKWGAIGELCHPVNSFMRITGIRTLQNAKKITMQYKG